MIRKEIMEDLVESGSPPRIVLTMDNATASASPSLAMAAWEPPLNARKPKNRMNPPKAAFYKCNKNDF